MERETKGYYFSFNSNATAVHGDGNNSGITPKNNNDNNKSICRDDDDDDDDDERYHN